MSAPIVPHEPFTLTAMLKLLTWLGIWLGWLLLLAHLLQAIDGTYYPNMFRITGQEQQGDMTIAYYTIGPAAISAGGSIIGSISWQVMVVQAVVLILITLAANAVRKRNLRRTGSKHRVANDRRT